MKYLNNEFEYRNWMTKDFLGEDDEALSLFEPDVLEREILRQMPAEFPCIVYEEKGHDPLEPGLAKFISRNQVAEWAKLMGIIK